MATIALDPAYRRVSVEEFLEMDFHGAKAELEDGLIYMMAGGSELHARIAGNIQAYLRTALRGTGCRPYGSDLAARTGERTVRFPDISVYCNRAISPEDELKKLIGDPTIVFEVLSPSTEQLDQKIKLEEYRALAGMKAIVFINPREETVRLVERTADSWVDHMPTNGRDLMLSSLGLTIPHAEIFARD